MTAEEQAPTGGAFFDLDKTLMAGSSAMVFGQVAQRHGMVSRRRIARWGLDHLRFRLRGSTDEQTEELMAVVREMLAGTPVEDLERLAPEILSGLLPRIYPAMLDEVHQHQDAGRPTFIVSAAGNEMVEALAATLGMEGGIGTRYEVANRHLTGELDGPFVYGEGKVAAMRSYAEEHGIDMEASFAYSDSVSDLPMLRSVGNPVAVNPDAALAAVAKAEGWRILRFEQLGRRLAVAGAALAAAAAGGGGTMLARRFPGKRTRRRTRRMLQRKLRR